MTHAVALSATTGGRLTNAVSFSLALRLSAGASIGHCLPGICLCCCAVSEVGFLSQGQRFASASAAGLLEVLAVNPGPCPTHAVRAGMFGGQADALAGYRRGWGGTRSSPVPGVATKGSPSESRQGQGCIGKGGGSRAPCQAWVGWRLERIGKQGGRCCASRYPSWPAHIVEGKSLFEVQNWDSAGVHCPTPAGTLPIRHSVHERGGPSPPPTTRPLHISQLDWEKDVPSTM